MEGAEDAVRNAQVVDARARNISHNVRCTECGSQAIEDSQTDIAVLLRKDLWLALGLAESLSPPTPNAAAANKLYNGG